MSEDVVWAIEHVSSEYMVVISCIALRMIYDCVLKAYAKKNILFFYNMTIYHEIQVLNRL